jgi:hypothetical protein
MKDLRQKDFNAVLLETNDFFKSQGINIIGEGFKEISTNPALFESYVEALTEGASADHAVVLAQLMANTNAGILRESSLSGIAPIASLSMPVIRKLWPKYAIKEVFKTEVAKTPRFVVSYMRPYMFRGDEARIYLPKGLVDNQPGPTNLGSIKDAFVTATVALAPGSSVNVNFGTAASSGSVIISETDAAKVSGTGVVTGSASKRQPLDSQLRVTQIALAIPAVENVQAAATVYVKVPTHKIDVTGSIFLSFDKEYAAIFTSTELTTQVSGLAVGAPKGYVSGQLIVRADLQAGTALVVPIGFSTHFGTTTTAVTTVTAKIVAGVSSEFNETGFSIGFDVARLDIDIPTGQHINAPLPIEALNDMMALYQIDGTKETVDLMTNVFATRLDIEALEFLKGSFDNQPGVAEFSDYPAASQYQLVFDVRPAAGFAGSPKAWREELKPQIDFLAQRIKNQTYLQAGVFTIIGNPLNIQILTNVDWQFRGGQGSNMDGVDVDYSIGTYVGANAYRVIASVNVPVAQGLFLVFTPSSETQMTYKYYPYTFSTEMGYIDPNRSRVPSIMMTKRHTFAEFLPAIGNIAIVNNDGINQFSQGYWPIQTGSNWGISGDN